MKDKRFFNRILIVLLMILLFIPSSLVRAEDITSEPEWNDEDGYGKGYIGDDFSDVEYMEDVELHTILEDDLECVTVSYQALPAFYRNTNVPEVRSQGSFGTCWAFSSIACMEINLKKKGYDVSLSELALAYYANHSVVDPLGGTAGDSYVYNQSAQGENYLHRGGSYKMAIGMMMDGCGLLLQDKAPYSMVADDFTLDDSMAYQADAVLLGAKYVNVSNRDLMKAAIMEYGAAGISIQMDTTSNYYNSKKYALYHPTGTGTDHAVTIVGWDDDFAADNFTQTPPGDGAWIIRNSWGAKWGESGYFYISYYDSHIASTAVFMDAEITKTYDNIYQYDGGGTGVKSAHTADKIGVIYETHANSQWTEVISGVAFETASADATYTVNVYTNLQNRNNPVNGTLAATVSGTIDHAGFYTVELEQEIEVEAEKLFSVVVDIDQKDNVNASYYLDYVEESPIYNGVKSYDAHIYRGANEDFSYKNGSWSARDAVDAEYGGGSFHVKAYTSNESHENRPVESITLDKSEITLIVDVEEEKLIPSLLPIGATNKEIEWSSLDETIATVENGTVKGITTGDTVIRAVTVDGGKVAECIVHVVASKQLETPQLVDKIANYSRNISVGAIEHANQYEYELLKDTTVVSLGIVNNFSYNYSWAIESLNRGSGLYTIRIRAVSNLDYYTPSEYATFEYQYVVPDKQLANVNMRWEGKVLKWDVVDGADAYVLLLKLNGQTLQNTYVSATKTMMDESKYFTAAGEYEARMYALCADINTASRSNTISKKISYGNVKTITLSKSSVELGVGETIQIMASYTPDLLIEEEPIKWMSENEQVATVDANGNVKAIAGGCTLIKAVSTVNEEIFATCAIRVKNSEQDQLTEFVQRMYTIALQRDAETQGLQFWITELASGEKSGSEVASAFLLSEELLGKGLSDLEYIKRCYATIFAREFTDAESDYWLQHLADGVTRRYIIAGFCGSTEFKELCQSFDVNVGEVALTAYADQNINLTKYISRCYEKILQRKSEADGVEYWAGLIIRKECEPRELAKRFVESDEFAQKRHDDVAYVEVLYQSFMGRVSDEAGMTFWMQQMHEQGMSREAVFEAFANSAEFAGILNSFGLE